MTAPNTAWRIGCSGALRCIIVRRLPGQGNYEVRASTASRDAMTVPMADVFPDREACRAEIQRRADARKETTP